MFSIIIPVYNIAPWLRECLDSVLNQTYGNWEAICVDDGSTDDSPGILDEYSVRDVRFRVLHKLNEGVSSARNAALDEAKGEWILFLDGDDVLNCVTLKRLNEIIVQESELRFAMFQTIEFVDGTQLKWSESESNWQRIDMTRYIVSEEMVTYFAGKAYRRDVIAELRFRPFAHGEDRLFLINFLKKVPFALRTNETFYGYRWRNGSATRASLDFQYFSDMLAYSIEMIDASLSSGKIFGRQLFHMIGAYVTDRYVWEIKRLPVRLRAESWRLWFEHSKYFASVKSLPLYCRIIHEIGGLTRSRFLVLMCVWVIKMLKRLKYFVRLAVA